MLTSGPSERAEHGERPQHQTVERGPRSYPEQTALLVGRQEAVFTHERDAVCDASQHASDPLTVALNLDQVPFALQFLPRTHGRGPVRGAEGPVVGCHELPGKLLPAPTRCL